MNSHLHKLSAENIDLGYGQNLVIDKLTLKVLDGKITSIIGPNGCGKSTLLRGLARFLKPKNGQVLLDGKDIQHAASVEKILAMLPQSPTVPDGLTVYELVGMGRYPYRSFWGGLTCEDREIIKQSLQMVEAQDLETRLVNSLSGGQRQRIWIAMTLAQQTDYLLLDEPTTYLDWLHQIEVHDLLHTLNRKFNKTIVMVLHDLNMASRYSDHLIGMVDGKIIAQGSPEKIMTEDCLKRIFGFSAKIINDANTNAPFCIPMKSSV